MLTHPFASSRCVPGRMPSVCPSRERAPREAASMTPPSPPVTTTAPPSARSAPTASAAARSSAGASPGPATATYGVTDGCSLTRAGVGLADDHVDELVGHDDDL